MNPLLYDFTTGILKDIVSRVTCDVFSIVESKVTKFCTTADLLGISGTSRVAHTVTTEMVAAPRRERHTLTYTNTSTSVRLNRYVVAFTIYHDGSKIGMITEGGNDIPS